MKPHRFVVFGSWVKGFDTLAEAKAYSLANVPSVICERREKGDGTSELREVLRHDYLFDESRGEWRFMQSSIGARACRDGD